MPIGGFLWVGKGPAVAEVDHFDEVVEACVAVGAVLDEADPGVEAFGEGVRQSVMDGVDDAVDVAAHASGEGEEAGALLRVAAVSQRVR